jgi:hypothetical protein
MKAFVQVGAAGRLADGMQVQSPQFCFERVNFLKMSGVLTQPLRQQRMRGRTRFELNQFELNQRIGRQINIFARSDS